MRRHRPPRRGAPHPAPDHLPDRGRDPSGTVLGHQTTGTGLHDARLDAVLAALHRHAAATVLDLGCGAGALLDRLAADDRFARIVGIDGSAAALDHATRATAGAADRVTLLNASFLDPHPALAGFDAAVLVESLEHVHPAELSRLEHAVFAVLRPALVVLTTPNRDYNVHLGLADGELRHPDHRFEWSRARLRAWADGVAGRRGYRAAYQDVGSVDAYLGAPTQLAAFTRLSNPAPAERPPG
jgi:small RNA 2'-O-methyltransferase